VAMLIRNARLVDPGAGIDGSRDLLAADGIVRAVAPRISPDEVRRVARGELIVVDAEGLWLWPGPIDAHVHLREPGFTHKETMASGTAAAAAGGFTAVVCEPNTDPPIDSVEIVRELARRAAGAPIRVYFKATMTRGRRGLCPSDVAELAAVPSVVALSDDGDPVVDAAVMERICRMAARSDVLLSPHCEDSPRALAEIAAGADPGFRPGAPYTNEAGYVARDVALAARAGCRIHFSHVSLSASLAAIAEARLGGARGLTCEATPHHLLLARDDFAADAVPTVTPPLRSSEERDGLRRALFDGHVDAVASDHAPHTAEEKAGGASGLIGLETTLGLVLTHLVGDGKLSVAGAVGLLSRAPARIFRLPGGTLAAGAPADMVLIDPALEWRVSPAEFRSLSRNTPYGGWRLRGRAVATFVGGMQVFGVPDFAGRLTNR